MSKLTFVSREQDGLSIHVLPTEKFKTTTILIHIQLPLQEDLVTKGALLPNVLQRGTATYPNPAQLQRHLDSLYGAIFSAGVMKRGEKQILQFYLEIANEKFLADSRPLLEDGMRFLGEVLTRPLLENGAFTKKIVELEKETLAKRIEGLIDDKMRYANQRLTEEMCKDEPYRLLAYGIHEQIPGITPEDLYGFYQEALTSYPIDMYIIGDVNPEDAVGLIRNYIPLTLSRVKQLAPTPYKKEVREERIVTEEMNVVQGKLNIGMRTQISYADDNYVHLMMYNGVLGGFPHSKLFMNVREKASLAYYAVSQLETQKGLCMIMSGIETANYDKALAIIKEQLEMMKQGEITDVELNQTKATLSNQLRETQDSASAIASMDYSGRLAGRHRTLEETLAAIESTTKEDIARVAQKVEIDTIYFLRGKGETK
ncbi:MULTISPECIES: EF-P 5-aminopentanol modification-associated protein YfmF [Aneurinibacillus]|uniref:Insulinase family protein n=1 Tax=Aneurinibacillus thermoaerophilus TaxID=143495 RepID=A0A1G8AFF0_ANETH|nr:MULTISPECIES: pitrilysin family protein [Aneurinibacillus]AMA73519.1 peptidase [Aneurinibacillus sp. XH2]MED0676694.1 pitrilysin family protein [Aneurinibacillus thermoaerophilus]MED0680036.1 pitrilysin family protein [Aneurinibacillus thermoaerophilus]MED0738447.1 pitrilysin family protein [Aneurinibacillus thermoaerophilus]MED0756089.1 pitrilysin family protein [Aneurinibacillus thermoaerophilus]